MKNNKTLIIGIMFCTITSNTHACNFVEQLNVDANNKNEITNMIFDNSAKNNVYKNGVHIAIIFSDKYYNFAIYDKEYQTNYNKSSTEISQLVNNLNKTIQ